MDPIFALEQTLSQEGINIIRTEVEISLAYCTSIIEMDSLVRQENNYDNSHPLRCKLSLSNGQGLTKFT